MKLRFLVICGVMVLSACATSSGVMQMADGSYMISAKAAPIRGGTSGANSMAYEEAQKFCATVNGKAVLISQQERDVYQGGSTATVNQSGGFGSSGFAAGGAASIRFKCVQ